MIVFKKIRFQNFLSYGNIFTEIELNRAKSTLIIGENGAGKSTMLDALSFGLYGKAFRKINKPQLINSITGKNTLVEVEFSVGNKEYMVRRGMKPNIFEIFENGKLIDQSSASRDYQQILEQNILKLNHKSFSQIIVLGSANFTPFMKLPAHARREVIEDLLDIQVFSVMNSLLKDKISNNRTDLLQAEHNVSLIESKIEMHKKHLEEMKRDNKELVDKKLVKIAEYEHQNKELEEFVEKKNIEFRDLLNKTKDTDIVSKKVVELEDIRKKAENRLKKANKEIEFYNASDVCSTCKQTIDEEFKTKVIEAKNKIVKELNDGLTKLEETYSKLSKKLGVLKEIREKSNKISNEIEDAKVKIAMNNRFIASLKQEIAELEKKFEKREVNDITDQLFGELASANDNKQKLIEEQDVYNLASQLLKDGGIKTKIIKQYIPVMNKLINKYLAAMDFFIEFNLDENFEETIKSRHRDEFSYESFSEGEKLRIDLSLLFAWRAIAKLRNSAATNLLIMDEIFDSSLDAAGTEEFMKILGTLAQDTNIFIISHKTDQLFDKFDEVIRFNKVKNFSQMVA